MYLMMTLYVFGLSFEMQTPCVCTCKRFYTTTFIVQTNKKRSSSRLYIVFINTKSYIIHTIHTLYEFFFAVDSLTPNIIVIVPQIISIMVLRNILCTYHHTSFPFWQILVMMVVKILSYVMKMKMIVAMMMKLLSSSSFSSSSSSWMPPMMTMT